jgi:putative salt-induced outer membrane protein
VEYLMRGGTLPTLLAVSFLFSATAWADPVPEKIADMIRAAANDGNPAELAATIKFAKKTNPRSVHEIDTLAAQLQAAADARHRAELLRRGFFEGWMGQGEVGASNSSGNTRSSTLALGLNFSRNGLFWDHSFNATADYQRDNGIESKDRYFASYSGHYKYSDRMYALGLLSWESDRFSGFDSRLSESIGLGYAILKGPRVSLSVEAGPALRQTDYSVGRSENEFAGRGSVNYLWKILPNLAFTEVVSYYGQSHDSTLTSDTGLTANLIGALSARASYHLQYETNPPLGLDKTDALTRLTLVYSF